MIIPRQWQQFQKLGNQWVFIFVNCIREIRLRRIPKTRGLSLTSTSSRCDCLNFPAGLTHPSSSPAPRENEDSSPSHFQTEVGRGWQGFPGGSDGKESACSAGDPGSIPGWGRSPGDGNGNPLQWIRTPWTEEPGRLQSMGLQRVRHQTQLSSSHTHTHTHTHTRTLFRSFSFKTLSSPPTLSDYQSVC